jgi:hypothetical protein
MLAGTVNNIIAVTRHTALFVQQKSSSRITIDSTAAACFFLILPHIGPSLKKSKHEEVWCFSASLVWRSRRLVS